jgi:glutamine amidotransferase
LLALVDYGAGNLESVRKGLEAAGATVLMASTVDHLEQGDGIVVPGVGSFRATASIAPRWREACLRRVEAGVPLLGICLGMQWLFDGSDEAPELSGLGLIPGRCQRIRADRPLKVPHVGWNALAIAGPSRILEGVADQTYVYFTHSFAAPVTPQCTASVTHGETFAAVVERGNVAGVQFHPEKSGRAGLRMLQNFVAMTRS